LVNTKALDEWVEFFRDFMPELPKSMSKELWERDMDLIRQAAGMTGYYEHPRIPRYFKKEVNG
jgi:hypothetical protein